MSKLKNWLLPILLVVGAIFDEYYSLVLTLVQKLELPSYWETVLQLVAVAVAIIIAKMQPPSLKKAKAAKEGHHIKR